MPRKKWYGIGFTIFFIASIFTNCAPTQTPQRLSLSQISASNYMPRVENFMIILDASSSMEMRDNGYRRFDVAKNMVYHISESIPDLEIKGGLRSLGHSTSVTRDRTKLFYGITPFDRADFQKKLDMITQPGGTSPLTHAIEAAHRDLEGTSGNVALIIVSDGADMDNTPLDKAEMMIGMMKDRLCVYTVQVGDDPDGKELLERIARKSACGKYVKGEALATASGLNAFVEDVFLEKMMDSDGDGVSDENDHCPNTAKYTPVDGMGCPKDSDGDGVDDSRDKCPNTTAGVTVDQNGCSKDSDGDGVLDTNDQCPGTAKGISVDAKGCPLAATKSATVTAAGTWLYEDIQFASGKAAIREQSMGTLNEIVQFLKDNPNIRVEIQGHTDSRGKRSYNLNLSERRARSVRNYLIDKGISVGRLESKGYGPDLPIATNNTAAGRERNRRVELKPIE